MREKRFLKAICCIMMLAMILILPTCVQAASGTGWAVYTDGKNVRLSHSKLVKTCTIQVEVGRTVYFDTLFNARQMSKVRYESSKPIIASINKKTGVLTTKKVGTTVIKATYNGKSYKCTLKVLQKGKLKSTTTYKNLNRAADALAKEYNTKITSKTFQSLAAKTYPFSYYENGKLWGGFVKTKKGNQLAAPSVDKATEVLGKIWNYAESIDPIHTDKIKLTSAKPVTGSNKITAKINRKPTLAEIYAINLSEISISSAKTMPKTALIYGDIFRVNVINDPTTGTSYAEDYDYLYNKITLKPNSNQVEIRLYTDRKRTKPYNISAGDHFYLNLSVYTDNSIII